MAHVQFFLMFIFFIFNYHINNIKKKLKKLERWFYIFGNQIK